MAMQISLDEVLSMLLARVDSLSMAGENLKSRFHILARALYRKGLLTDQDVLEAVQAEHQLLVDLGALPQLPDQENLKAVTDGILQWIKGDVAAIKQGIQDYEKKVQEMIKEEERKPRIDVASAADLQRLDRMSGGKGKLLLP